MNLKQSIRRPLPSLTPFSASQNTKLGLLTCSGSCVSSSPVCVAINCALFSDTPLLASLLGFKTFRVATSLLLFFWRFLEVVLSLFMTSVAVSNIKSQLLPKFCGSKQAQQQESSWRLESHLEENVSPVSNVRLLQRNGCLDPRIIRRLTGPRVSRIPERICGRATSY